MRQYEPGYVAAILTDSPTPYYVCRSFSRGRHIGYWQGWANDDADAITKAERVYRSCVSNGRCAPDFIDHHDAHRLTRGQVAALVTGADLRSLLAEDR